MPSELAGAARGLKVFAGALVITGLAFSLASVRYGDAPVRLFAKLVFLGDEVARTDYGHLVSAILGGVMTALGVMVWLVVDQFAAIDPVGVKKVIGASVVAWFVLDSAGSIAAGAWFNVVLNLGFLALALVPLRKIKS